MGEDVSSIFVKQEVVIKTFSVMMHPDSLRLKEFARELRSWDSVAYLSSLALNDLH